jgi:hypothetical protein
VREVERRAFQKIRNHPLMRQVWQEYVAGTLEENRPHLTTAEIQALFAMPRTPEERHVIQRVLRIVQA